MSNLNIFRNTHRNDGCLYYWQYSLAACVLYKQRAPMNQRRRRARCWRLAHTYSRHNSQRHGRVHNHVCYICIASTSVPPTNKSVPLNAAKLTEADVLTQYADLFGGTLDLLDGEVHLETGPNICPVQMPLRRLPVAIQDRVQLELTKMVQDDIITPVTEPTPWVSALLVVTKPDGGLRIIRSMGSVTQYRYQNAT